MITGFYSFLLYFNLLIAFLVYIRVMAVKERIRRLVTCYRETESQYAISEVQGSYPFTLLQMAQQ